VLQISVGATSQAQGQYAYTISGIVPQDVYAMADELLKKLQQFKGFASVRSDYYHSTPNLRSTSTAIAPRPMAFLLLRFKA
jgi:hypothetical protein